MPALAVCPDFNVAPSYIGGLGSWWVATADFNGDGRPDFAVANYQSNTISVFIGNGDGTLQNAVDYPVGTQPTNIAAADFNGDGKIDLVVPNHGLSTVSILLGNGNGTFAAATNAGSVPAARNIAVGDFNGDGKKDLAVTGDAANQVNILLGNGNGTFAPRVFYSVVSSPVPVIVGDWNGDGKPDLAVGGFGNLVSILLNTGTGTFGAAINYPTGAPQGFAIYLASADFDGDSKVDLAISNGGFGSFPGNAAILRGNGDGTFNSATSYNVGQNPTGIAVGDWNGDSKLDLVVGHVEAPSTIYINDGSGRRYTSLQFGDGKGTVYGFAIADLDRDGRLDIAVARSDAPNVVYFGGVESRRGTR